MNLKMLFAAGCAFGFLGVLFGAFGAHALKAKLSQEMLHIFEVGVRYQMYHALALLAAAWAYTQFNSNFAAAAGWFFTLGICIFSGSLYVLALSGIRGFGAVAPVGGLCLMMGWIILLLSAFRRTL